MKMKGLWAYRPFFEEDTKVYNPYIFVYINFHAKFGSVI